MRTVTVLVALTLTFLSAKAFGSGHPIMPIALTVECNISPRLCETFETLFRGELNRLGGIEVVGYRDPHVARVSVTVVSPVLRGSRTTFGYGVSGSLTSTLMMRIALLRADPMDAGVRKQLLDDNSYVEALWAGGVAVCGSDPESMAWAVREVMTHINNDKEIGNDIQHLRYYWETQMLPLEKSRQIGP